jgi:hypothetical protein
MSLTFTPTFVVPSNGRLIVTLSGAGLGCTAGAAVSFFSPSEGVGFYRVKFELFLSINGGSVADLKASSKYTSNTPDRVWYISNISISFNASNHASFGVNGTEGIVRDNYGARFTATLCPTVSGVYQLSLTADDAAELSIGRQDEATKTVIGPSGSSLLQYGFDVAYRYNVEVLFKESGGADYVSLLWKPPGASSFVDVPTAAFCLASSSFSAQVLTVTLTSFAPFGANSAIGLTFGTVTNPSAAQPVMAAVASAVVDAKGVILGTGVLGSFPAVFTADAPTITLSNVVKAAAAVTMFVDIAPSVELPSNGKMIIALSGAGLIVKNGALSFTSPSTGASGTASISGSQV